MSLFEIKNLSVSVSEKSAKKTILQDVNLQVNENETIVLLGQNGSGKSTVASTVGGLSKYKITSGEIIFDGKKINKLSADKRAKMGLFMSHQNPIEIPGISTREMLFNAISEKNPEATMDEVQAKISEALKKLELNYWFCERELNVGFSGGEKRKNEVLQMMVLEPKLAILDEIDSGLDIDSTKTVFREIMNLKKKTKMGLLIITHNIKVLSRLKVDRVYVMKNGKVAMSGDKKLGDTILEKGFSETLKGVK